jgi:hypothetical protein
MKLTDYFHHHEMEDAGNFGCHFTVARNPHILQVLVDSFDVNTAYYVQVADQDKHFRLPDGWI